MDWARAMTPAGSMPDPRERIAAIAARVRLELDRPWIGVALGVLGAVTIAILVSDAGPAEVLEALRRALPYLPSIALAEMASALADVIALRSLHGPGIPAPVWARSAATAYAAGALLPAGRVAGELARAAQIAPHAGGPRALAAASVLHATFLAASVIASLSCWAAVERISPGSALGTLIAGNAVFHAVLAGMLFLGPRAGARLSGGPIDLGAPWAALAAMVIARVVQLLQCAALVLAAGGGIDLDGALVAEAIQLVAASLGDAIPGQAGVIEGAYRTFAPELGLVGSLAGALTIALSLRATRLALAALASILVWAGRR